MERTHRQSINLCVRVAMGEIVANSGTKDPVSKEDRAQDSKDVEALGGTVTKLQLRLGQLCNPSTHRELLEHQQVLECDLRAERAKVQAREEAIADSIQIREGLERDLVTLRNGKDATNRTDHKGILALEARLQEVQGSLDRAAGKYTDLNRDHGRLLEELQSHKSGTEQWKNDRQVLHTQVNTLRGDESRLEDETKNLRSQLRTLQAEKDDPNRIGANAPPADPEMGRLRIANSNVRTEVMTLKTRIRELEERASITDRLGPGPTAEEDHEHHKKKKTQWKNHAKALKQSLEEKEAELESALSENRGLTSELKRIHDRAKNEAAMLSRRFPTFGGRDQDDAEEDDDGEGDEESEEEDEEGHNRRRAVLEGYKQPMYNMIVGYRDTGAPRRRDSQPNTGNEQDEAELPDVALRPKSKDPVPRGYAVVKEIARPGPQELYLVVTPEFPWLGLDIEIAGSIVLLLTSNGNGVMMVQQNR
ncbi:hypothetical protein DL98DRAFT_540469 [Cadophora sp. DSE1049]|nr:hypothetical protein DL98DRAFT_540469 [Cadophora sp. DSE1049]